MPRMRAVQPRQPQTVALLASRPSDRAQGLGACTALCALQDIPEPEGLSADAKASDITMVAHGNRGLGHDQPSSGLLAP
jgi:hypothetical protein